MPRQRRKEAVYGPYRVSRGRWRIIYVGRDGSRSHQDFAEEGAAERAGKKARRTLAKYRGLTVSEALGEHEVGMRTRGFKPSSVTTFRIRMAVFFASVMDEDLAVLTRRDIERLVEKYATSHASTTTLNVLEAVKTFFKQAVARQLLPESPAKDVMGPGRRSRGKKQLRVDEARRWLARALELVPKHPQALAATLALILGMRASEITGLAVRDLDDEGKILWVAAGGGKTEAATRRLEVPDLLRQLLLSHAAGKAGESPLFPISRHSVLCWVKKICKLAQVPVVSAHGLRGTHSTLATTAGATSHFVVQAMGHTSFEVTRRHYLAPGTEENARSKRAFEVLQGGKSVNDTIQSFTSSPKGTNLAS